MPELNLTIIEVAFNDGALQSMGNALRVEVPGTIELKQSSTPHMYTATVAVDSTGDVTRYRIYVHVPTNGGKKNE